MKKNSVAVACVAAFATILALASACNTDIPQQPCRDIPDGGCPAYDNACNDPTCFTLYDCSPDDTWVVDMVCPAKTPVDADGIPIDSGSDGAGNVDASAYLAVPGALGGPGCQDLQNPDCSLGSAAACTDCCGCEDLYVCNSGGWNLWGVCTNGQISQVDGGN
ncbi:MAG: hypothetical protein ABI183_12950 [Polyangiaceae bacterium]